jgi:hypothetical protein
MIIDPNAIQYFMENANANVTKLFGDATCLVGDLKVVSNTPFCYGAVNLIYGVQNHGKTYQTLELLSKAVYHSGEYMSTDMYYLSNDGSMSRSFLGYCRDRMVSPIDYDSIVQNLDTDIRVTVAITQMATQSRMRDKRSIIVIDSLSSFIDDVDINSSQAVGAAIKVLNDCAKANDCCLVVIDHATEIRDKGVVIGSKIEGNASGKQKYTATSCSYMPLDTMRPENGGTFTVQRSRVQDDVPKGKQFIIKNDTERKVKEATERLLELKSFTSKVNNRSISKTDFSRAIKNERDKWIRELKDELFDESIIDNITYLSLKEHIVI